MLKIKYKLKQGFKELKIQYTEKTISLLLDYLLLLKKWNEVINLTAVRKIDEMVVIHILDSLAIFPFVNRERIIDLGSGAGLPGIPLAIMLPDQKFYLLEKHNKKCTFLRQAKRDLSLNNIEIVQSSAEDFHVTEKFDMLVSRAVAGVDVVVQLSKHLLKPDCKYLLMKGKYPQEEIKALKQVAIKFQLNPLKVPFLNAERHLLTFKL